MYVCVWTFEMFGLYLPRGPLLLSQLATWNTLSLENLLLLKYTNSCINVYVYISIYIHIIQSHYCLLSQKTRFKISISDTSIHDIETNLHRYQEGYINFAYLAHIHTYIHTSGCECIHGIQIMVFSIYAHILVHKSISVWSSIASTHVCVFVCCDMYEWVRCYSIVEAV